MYHVYQIINTINGKYYIGVHKTDDFESSLYMGSGPLIKKAVKKYGRASFIRESLCAFEDCALAYAYEKNIVDPTDPLCYNLNTGGCGGFDYINSLGLDNPMHNPEVVKKNIESRKSHVPSEKAQQARLQNLQKAVEYNTGKTQSEGTKQKRAESLRKYWETHDRTPYKLTEEHKQKISDSWDEDKRAMKSEWMKERIKENPNIVKTNLGKTFSDETKSKMSESAKASWENREVTVCPYCGKSSNNASNMKRWHFDNCKLKDQHE